VKIISSFILLLKNINNRLFVGIDASGFKLTNSSQYYTDRAKLRKKYLKLSLAADVVVCQIICTIKIRRYPRNDTIDFQPPLITKTCKIIPISITVADKGYDSSEDNNHILVREEHLHGFSIIPARYEHVPIRRTHGKYRKQMKRGIPGMLYYIRETRMKL
jgi:hypothetical protein